MTGVQTCALPILISAARKIEHTKNGAIVEKVSIETGGPKDENGKATPLEIASSDEKVSDANNVQR